MNQQDKEQFNRDVEAVMDLQRKQDARVELMQSLAKRRKGTLRGICGVCGLYHTEIANEFAGGKYYERVCDGCWYDAHPYSLKIPRDQRNVMLESYSKPLYQPIYEKWKKLDSEEVYGDSEQDVFESAVREWVDLHWSELRSYL